MLDEAVADLPTASANLIGRLTLFPIGGICRDAVPFHLEKVLASYPE